MKCPECNNKNITTREIWQRGVFTGKKEAHCNNCGYLWSFKCSIEDTGEKSVNDLTILEINRQRYINEMKERGIRVLSTLEKLETSDTHGKESYHIMLSSFLTNAENFEKESTSIVENYYYYANRKEYIEQVEAFLYREINKESKQIKELYLVKHHSQDKIHCMICRVDSEEEALKEAKCHLSKRALKEMRLDNVNYYLIATKIDSILLCL